MTLQENCKAKQKRHLVKVHKMKGFFTMILSDNDAKYFYELWIPLLDYVNKKCKILPELYGMSSPAGLPIQKIASITNKLWEDASIIDEYISSSDSLNQNDKVQIMMWKDYFLHDKFIVDRHLKDGSIFISLQTEKIYLVKGIYSSIREMLDAFPMPQVVMATLIPFKDVIIHDGIVMPYGITLGKNMSDQSKELYRFAKANDEIIRSIP